MSIPNDGPFHEVGTTCKFCRKPITIKVADSYDIVADPHKLMPLAACNRCADLRNEKRSLEEKIKSVCHVRSLMRPASDKAKNEDRATKFRTAIDALLKQYANLIARWHFMSGMSWEDAITDAIVKEPGQWPNILATMWKLFKDSNPDRVRA